MLAKGLGGRGKVEVSRFKGLGEMMPAQLEDTTMSPATRRLIKVTVAEDEGETAGLVERLMGKRPELRFQYVQENARFVRTWTSDRNRPDCGAHGMWTHMQGR